MKISEQLFWGFFLTFKKDFVAPALKIGKKYHHFFLNSLILNSLPPKFKEQNTVTNFEM